MILVMMSLPVTMPRLSSTLVINKFVALKPSLWNMEITTGSTQTTAQISYLVVPLMTGSGLTMWTRTIKIKTSYWVIMVPPHSYPVAVRIA